MADPPDLLWQAKQLTGQIRWYSDKVRELSARRDPVIAQLAETMTTRQIGEVLGMSNVAVTRITNRFKWGQTTGGLR